MKFLSIWKLKDGISLPPAALRPLAEAQTAYTDMNLKQGKIDQVYFVPGWGKFIIVSENKTAEDWLKEAGGSPMFMLYDVELYPLADWKQSVTMMIETMKKAEVMMASAPK
jgi:hypothetical protein